MSCLNPELKLESLKRTFPDITLTYSELKDEMHSQKIENICNKVKESGKRLEFIEWVKGKSKNGKKTSYFTEKKVAQPHPQNFLLNFKKMLRS